jgi:hypothetical protein
MEFNLSGVRAETYIFEKREAAYHELMRRISGHPVLEQDPVFIDRIADRGEPQFDFEFVGFRPFGIEGIKI